MAARTKRIIDRETTDVARATLVLHNLTTQAAFLAGGSDGSDKMDQLLKSVEGITSWDPKPTFA